MKKKLLALALAMVTLLTTACGGGAEYVQGTFTETGYESEYLGFRFTTPDGFALSTREELDTAMSTSMELLGDDYTDAQKKYAELVTIYEMMVSDELGTVNANIVLEKTNLSVDKYIDAVKTQMEGLSAMTVTVDEDVTDVEFAGTTYKKLCLDTEMQGIVLNQDCYFRKVGDRVMMMTVTWLDEFADSKDALINAFAAY